MSEDKKDQLRITGQFRTKDSRVYDLKAHGNPLTLRFTQRDDQTDPNEWRVDATSGTATETPITAWGETPTGALRATGEAWALRRDLALPQFDWDAIRALLESVRAF